MTGYGRARAEMPGNDRTIEVEIATVNRRNLDLQVSAPREWTGLEQRLGEWLAGYFQRGRIQIGIKPAAAACGEDAHFINAAALDRTLAELGGFAESRGIGFEPDAALLADLARTSVAAVGLPDWREIEDSLKAAVMAAAVEADAMRAKEGGALAADLGTRMASLDRLRESIAEKGSGAAAEYRDVLLERLRQLDLDLDPADERVLREVALFADRSDISEELTRLGSHFEQFSELLGATDPTGRRLDFLCQEIHREFNTIASKATRIGITRAVIEAKNTLEQIREQVQNVE